MRRLLVCSLEDIPSVNMKDLLLKMRDWEDIGSDGRNTFQRSGDMFMMVIPDLHIFAESLDSVAERFGIHADEMIFMSRHKAASAIPTLTVHPIGNFNNADFGGRPKRLVKATPSSMTDALRRMRGKDTGAFKVSFEVTHHGPFLETPTFFIEIGSDETMWGDLGAAELLAEVLTEIETNDFPNAVGLGGGHYAPRFTEIASSYKINFGHMVPSYAFDKAGDDEVLRMVRDASDATGSKMVYIHRKSMKKPEASRISDLLVSEGFELISSKDLDPIGNQ